MGCLPFCCCLQNFRPKVYAFIALGLDIAKIVLSICSFFLIEFSIVFAGAFINIPEFFPTVANLILMIVLIIFLTNRTAYNENNSCCKCMCITSFILSGIILLWKIIFFALFIYYYNKAEEWIKEEGINGASTSDWLKLIIPYILYFIIEIVHIIAVIYLYKLLDLKSSVCYRDFINKSQNAPISVTVTNAPIMQTSPIFQNQLPPQEQQNVKN